MNFYLSIVTIAIVFFVGLSIVGDDANSNLSLDEKSIDYVAELKGIAEDENYNAVAETTSYDSENQDPLNSGENTSVSDNNDFLSTLFIKKERANQPTSYFKIIYNIPTTILKGIGLPIDGFKFIINTFVYALLMAIILMIWGYVRP